MWMQTICFQGPYSWPPQLTAKESTKLGKSIIFSLSRRMQATPGMPTSYSRKNLDWNPNSITGPWILNFLGLFEVLNEIRHVKPVNLKGNQPWIFIGRTEAEAEASLLWLPVAKSWLIGKDPDAGKEWRQEEKGMTEDEMVGWHHWLYGHEFEQALGVGEGQGSLVCCSPWGHKGSDTTERLNNNNIEQIWKDLTEALHKHIWWSRSEDTYQKHDTKGGFQCCCFTEQHWKPVAC